MFDNVHVLKDKALLNLLSWFLHHLQDSLRVILCGRRLPDIYLSDLAMEDALVFLRQDDLLFEEEEELHFLKVTLQLKEEDAVLRSMRCV